MDIYFGGAENPTQRRRLLEAGATHLVMSFWGLSERLPVPEKRTGWLEARVPYSGVLTPRIMLDSGGWTARRNRDRLTDDEWIDYASAYADFVAANYERLECFTEFDFWLPGDLRSVREAMWAPMDPDNKFIPVWHREQGWDELEISMGQYQRVAIDRDSFKDDAVLPRVRAAAGHYDARVYGLGITGQLAEQMRFHAVTTTSWTSPMRNGETIWYEAGELTRYPSADKEKVRREMAPRFEREGFDAEMIQGDHPEELTAATVWAFQQWADGIRVPSTSAPEDPEPNAEPVPPAPAPHGSEVRNLVDRGPGKLLPVIQRVPTTKQVEKDGELVTVDGDPTIGVRSSSLRQCDTCFVKTYCPEYAVGSNCAYDIPVEIKTKDQLVGLMQGLLEMQTQRVMFARFAEELEGGMPTKTVSAELDRFFEMTEKAKTIQDDRDFMRISVETRSGAGVLSRLFGDSVGTQARQLDAPIDADEIIAEVIDE